MSYAARPALSLGEQRLAERAGEPINSMDGRPDKSFVVGLKRSTHWLPQSANALTPRTLLRLTLENPSFADTNIQPAAASPRHGWRGPI